jgi:hypothetical protein
MYIRLLSLRRTMPLSKLTEAERAERLPALHAAGWALVDGRDALAKAGGSPCPGPPLGRHRAAHRRAPGVDVD